MGFKTYVNHIEREFEISQHKTGKKNMLQFKPFVTDLNGSTQTHAMPIRYNKMDNCK